MTSQLEFVLIIHEAEEGGYWSEVPSLPGAGSQGETVDELRQTPGYPSRPCSMP